MTETTVVGEVHGLWLDAVRFIKGNATPVWAGAMRHGAVFVMPPHVSALSGFRQQAEALARLEAKRLRDAELFYVTARAAQAATDRELLSPADVSDITPAPAGMMVWEEPPVWIEEGMPIRAATWGPAFDGGVWASWWTDTRVCVREGLLDAAVLPRVGKLSYHQEVHLQPRMWAAQADDPNSSDHHIFRALLGTWAAVASGAVERTDSVSGTVAERRIAKRLGVAPRPVHQLRPSASGGTDPTPQDVVRRLLELDGITADGQPYPRLLPPEVAPWHFHTPEGGHRVFVQVTASVTPENLPPGEAFKFGELVAAPVKAVLKAGWTTQYGYLHSPLLYDNDLGLLTDPAYDDF